MKITIIDENNNSHTYKGTPNEVLKAVYDSYDLYAYHMELDIQLTEGILTWESEILEVEVSEFETKEYTLTGGVTNDMPQDKYFFTANTLVELIDLTKNTSLEYVVNAIRFEELREFDKTNKIHVKPNYDSPHVTIIRTL